MSSGSRMMPFLLMFFLLSGCAGSDLIVKRQAESEAKIEYLIQTSKKAEQRLNELAAALQSQDERLQSSQGGIKQLKEETAELRAARDDLKTKLASLPQQNPVPKVEVVYQPSLVNSGRETGPPADYLTAFGLYSANNFPAAISSFETFLKNNPQSDYAANALYWIGECHYSLADLPRAQNAFSRVAENYPKSSKAPDALLKLGYTLAALKEKGQAATVFEKVISMYPSSPAALKARERMITR